MAISRPNSIGFCGGAYGDEGKGRIVDEVVANYAKERNVVVYRDNGGANAGHTVEFSSGKRVALHQLPSGVFHERATVVLGKGMVIHPADLLLEIEQVKLAANGVIPATIKVDEQAVLSLDTHRALEGVLKEWEEGGKGSTGRGIAPAYVDIIYRHPVRLRDLVPFNTQKFEKHYKLYAAFVSGLGKSLEDIEVPQLGSDTKVRVGSFKEFVGRLEEQSKQLSSFIQNIYPFLERSWRDSHTAFVFEKAQAIGLDIRWGVYPDVTASDCTFDGIYSATEGIIDPNQISVRAATIKATYMSSVGTRKLPTSMDDNLADRIREDAHEYGATTRRPRGIAHLDIPALKFFATVGKCNYLLLTHMDIVYSDTPIKVCTGYTKDGGIVSYRPDQDYLNTVKPVYTQLDPWDAKSMLTAKNRADLPKQAKKFLRFIEKQIGIPVYLITTGPKRDQSILLK